MPMSNTKVVIPAFQDIVELFDMEKVIEAIWTPDEKGRKPTYGWDEFDNIKEMVWAAASKWLARDLVEFNITGVERLTEYSDIKGYMDVEATMKGLIKPFDNYAGKKIVVDWKTRDGELDDRWRARLIDSWQWKIYASMTDASIFSYRGISRRCPEGECSCKEILLPVPAYNSDAVYTQLEGQKTMISALIEGEISPWPMHMPDACNKYGRECEYYDDCSNYRMPLFTPPDGKVLSYSRLDDFARCPELYRRRTRDEGEEGESLLGSGVHFALAELYKQAALIKI
jgi:hypothetical protein